MHKRGIIYIIIAIAALMLAVVFWLSFIADVPLLEHIKFEEVVYGLEIEPYYDETDDVYYLFIPSYVKPDDIKIGSSDFVDASFSDEAGDYGAELSEVPLSQNITLTLTNFFRKETYSFQIWQCETLPTVYIETESGSMDYVNEDKDNEEDATVIFINTDGTIEFSGLSSITGRGNTTWGQAKNPYNLKFSSDISIWDFTDINALCLLANYCDYSCMRDAIVHYVARENNIAYSSDYQFVNMYTNGDYMGLYAVATKQEYKKHIKTDGITAVFEITRYGEEDKSFQSKAGTNIEAIYGEMPLIEEIIDKFETALLQYNFEEAFSYIDVESFAKKYTLEEIFLNMDMTYENSQYFYIDDNNIIHCMCAWDYDRTFGFYNGAYYNNHPVNEMIVYYRDNNSWYKYLIKSRDFCEEIITVLNTDYTDSFIREIDLFMENCISDIETSWRCNNVRWEHEYTMWKLGFENLREFLEFYHLVIDCRRDFLTDYLLNQENYCIVSFSSGSPVIYTNICIPYGEKLSGYIQDYTLTKIDKINGEKFLGWYTKDDMTPEDIDEVTENINFYGTWETSEKTAGTNVNATVKNEFEESSAYTQVDDGNLLLTILKKIYHGFGLDSFGIARLIICGLFGLVLLGLLCVEIIRWIRQRRSKK